MDKVYLLIFAVGPVFQSGDTANIGISKNEINLADQEYSYPQYNYSENGYSSSTEMNEADYNSTNDPGYIFPEDDSIDFFNFTDVIEPPQNLTCIRRDYEDDVSAIFRGEAGDIETASIVFNSTYDSAWEGLIYNSTEYSELQVLNETVVECYKYFTRTRTRILKPWTSYSLAG